MANDPSVRTLTAINGASTNRVLNLLRIDAANQDNPEHAQQPLFTSPVINKAILIKHRLRPDEAYLFPRALSVATKIVIPFDSSDLRAGAHSLFVNQQGYADALRGAGQYHSRSLDRDLAVLRLLDGVPSLDPFLLRELLRANQIDVAPCYFTISEADQLQMHEFVSQEMSHLIVLAGGDALSSSALVSAMLSNEIDEKLDPLRATLCLDAKDFREGMFCWRGFLYYKWSIDKFWPSIMGVLREISAANPVGSLTAEQKIFLAAARRKIIETVRDNAKHATTALSVYDTSFHNLVQHRSPKTFRDFLMSAPSMFLELGEKLGAISHIVSFWRFRFPPGASTNIDGVELAAIFRDFSSAFSGGIREESSLIKKPVVLDMTTA